MGAKLVFSDENWLPEIVHLVSSNSINPKKYSFGSIDGIYVSTKDGKDIIAIFNNCPHNGDFDRFIMALERYAKKTSQRIAICSFFNERLYWHLRKRQGWGNEKSTMDRLEYYGKN